MKTNAKINFLFILFLLSAMMLNAQDTTGTALRSAFETSYIFEDAKQYGKAVTSVKNMYDATDFPFIF